MKSAAVASSMFVEARLQMTPRSDDSTHEYEELNTNQSASGSHSKSPKRLSMPDSSEIFSGGRERSALSRRETSCQYPGSIIKSQRQLLDQLHLDFIQPVSSAASSDNGSEDSDPYSQPSANNPDGTAKQNVKTSAPLNGKTNAAVNPVDTGRAHVTKPADCSTRSNALTNPLPPGKSNAATDTGKTHIIMNPGDCSPRSTTVTKQVSTRKSNSICNTVDIGRSRVTNPADRTLRSSSITNQAYVVSPYGTISQIDTRKPVLVTKPADNTTKSRVVGNPSYTGRANTISSRVDSGRSVAISNPVDSAWSNALTAASSAVIRKQLIKIAASSKTTDDLPTADVNKRRKKGRITVDLSGTRYEVVRDMVEYLGYSVVLDCSEDTFLIWTDPTPSNERISDLKPYQRINHFPGMAEICRKDSLARNMAKMARVFPMEYNFVPKTWVFPSEYAAFQAFNHDARRNKKRNKTYIIKPANGAMGNGIQLVRYPERIQSYEHVIVQQYIDKPFLVDGFKCDLRIYVLVTSCDPLRIFLFNDGLLRMSTEPYVTPAEQNLDHLFMHLTNYSINKHSSNYKKDDAGVSGSKRSLRYFNEFLRHLDYDVCRVWTAITDLIIKTMIVAHPHVFHAYRMCRPAQPPGSESVCFEILGFDVILDHKLRPWLLEVNRSPSFATDEQLDYDIKSALIEDALRLININCQDKKRNMAEEKAQAQRRLLRVNKRSDLDREQQRQAVERRRQELCALLERIQRDEEREEHENRCTGRYHRIFPPVDRLTRERYANLLANSYRIFLSGHQALSLELEIQRLYSSDPKEYEIRELLAQCESDEPIDNHALTFQSLIPAAALTRTSSSIASISTAATVGVGYLPRPKRPFARWRPSGQVSARSSLTSRMH